MISKIISYLFNWLSQRARFKQIKEDPEKKEKSVYFGVTAIIKTISYAILTALSILGFIYCFKALSSESLGVILAFFGVVCCAIFAIYSTVSLIFSCPLEISYQLRLNKRAIGWLALVLYIACVGVAVFVIVYFGMQIN